MKAYYSNNEDGSSIVVYAETHQEAKKQAYINWDNETEYIDVRVSRLPQMDDTEDMPKLKKILILVRDLGWWYEYDGVEYSHENLKDLELLVHQTYKHEEREIYDKYFKGAGL